MTLRERPARLRAVQPIPARRPSQRVVCIACGLMHSEHDARLEAWQCSRDGRQIHCRACAERLALPLDDVVLYWPVCGHPAGDDELLFDRAICVICDTA